MSRQRKILNVDEIKVASKDNFEKEKVERDRIAAPV